MQVRCKSAPEAVPPAPHRQRFIALEVMSVAFMLTFTGATDGTTIESQATPVPTPQLCSVNGGSIVGI